jgi:flagellar biosynthetic protein FlhB
MADEDKDSKTENATPYRLRKARDKGSVAKSKELAPAVTLTVVTFFFFFGSYRVLNKLLTLIKELLQISNFTITSTSLYTLMYFVTVETAKIIAPFLLMILLTGVAVNIYQVGIMFSTEALAFKFDKLNPLKGWARFFSKKSLVELLKSLFKIFVIGYIAYSVMKNKMVMASSLSDLDIQDILKFYGLMVFDIMWRVCIAALIMAIADWYYQKYQFGEDMKMTKQEVKDERKQMEGDPHIKNKIRAMQRNMARQRMMESVPQADVVVTNPTHYAVAIRYNPGEDRAPVVVAKGQRLIALRIREIARQNGILVYEDPPIARSLFKTVDIGDEIPENLYKAVAEILAHLNKFKR